MARLIRAFLAARWYVAAGALLGAVAMAAYSHMATRQYRAEVKFTIREGFAGSGGLQTQLANQLGGLASLAGVSIGDGDAQEGRAIELLTSHGFLAAFVQDDAVLRALFPGAARQEGSQPTEQQAVRKLKQSVLSITENKRTGVFSLSIRLPDRQLAASWANILITRANEHLREEAVGESTRSRQFLEEQVLRSEIQTVREAGFRLIESELKSEMLARTQDEFAYRVVDAAYVPDERYYVYPKRNVMVAGGFLVGGSIGFLSWGFVVVLLGVLRRSRA